MKKKQISLFIAILLIFATMLSFGACSKNDSSENSDPTTTTDKVGESTDKGKEGNDISALIGTWYYIAPDSELEIPLYLDLNADGTASTYIKKDETKSLLLSKEKDIFKELLDNKGMSVEEFLENSGYATLDEAAEATLKGLAVNHGCTDIIEYIDSCYKDLLFSGTFKKISDTEISVNSDGEETVYKFTVSEDNLTIIYGDTTLYILKRYRN